MNEQQLINHLPTHFRDIQYSETELNEKLIHFQGIISSSIPFSPHSSKYSNNVLANTIEAMVFDKIRTSKAAQLIFINYFNNNQEWIRNCSYLKISHNLESLNKLIEEIHKYSR